MTSQQMGLMLSKLGIGTTPRKGVGFNYAPFTVQQGQPTPGQSMFDKVGTRKDTGDNIYNQYRQDQTNRVAEDVAGKSAFNIPRDEFGLVKQDLTDFRPLVTQQVKSISDRGKNALLAAQARNTYQQAVQMQNLGQYGFTGSVDINGTDVPGASGNNIGAKAVSLALQTEKNGTPYVWGGNSLNSGVDCSGLIQQIYRQLGVNVPRTTYEQAKSGRVVGLGSIRPGDLVFYNNNSHVGLYIGNGKIVHAANSKLGIITSSLYNSNGSPTVVVRPY